MTKKKKFEKPSMQVIELQHEQQLLAGSAKSGTLNDLDDYESDTDPFDF